jgi:hypothetical protein
LNRDPIQETGGSNLYTSFSNQPSGSIDALGLLALADFNPLLLFDAEAWGSMIYDQAVPKPACPFDRESNLRMLAEEGHEVSQFEDADGRPISGGRLVAGVGGVVVVSTLSAVVNGVGTAGKGGQAAAQANHAKCAVKGLRIPNVANHKLGNIVNDLYKGAKMPNPIGTGSTADAIRSELATGLPTGGKFHTQKGQEYIKALSNWLKKNPNASEYDRLVAESLMNDLASAISGN